jgi:hypothetical protein
MTPRFIDGEEYSFGEIEASVWGPVEAARQLGPDARFIYRAHPRGFAGEFVEVVEESPYGLVPADEVHDAIEELRGRGLSTRDIARRAGVSSDAVDRAAGHGSIRRATAAAIRAAANDETDDVTVRARP